MRLFQSHQPLVHALHSELVAILQTMKGRVCKPDTRLNDDIYVDNLLAAAKIDCAEATKKYLSKLSESERLSASYKIQRHCMAVHNYLLNKFANDVLRSCQCLQPSEIANGKSLKRVGHLAATFAFTGVNALQAKDEWRILLTEVPVQEEDTRIDLYWKKILSRKTALGEKKYPTLEVLVKASLSLAHGNADVKRGFSISRRILSDDKCKMSEGVLNERLLIRDSLKRYTDISQIVITKELVVLTMNEC